MLIQHYALTTIPEQYINYYDLVSSQWHQHHCKFMLCDQEEIEFSISARKNLELLTNPKTLRVLLTMTYVSCRVQLKINYVYILIFFFQAKD